jgi:membrane protease YdiL (CAAX protease family)
VTSWFTNWVKRSPLIAFFALVFGIEWLLFFILLFLPSLVPPLVALLIGSWLPNAIGLLVTGVGGGRPGLRELFGRVILWRISLKWYAIASFVPAVVAFLAIGLYALFGNVVPDFASADMLLPLILLAVFTGATGEELGWRGTALPRLQARWNVLTSSLVLGVFWGLYHLPSFFLSGMPLENAPLITFMVGAAGINVFISWIFNRTGGSLIMVVLFHFALNFMGNVTGIFNVPALFGWLAGIYCVVAIVVIVFDWALFTRLTAPSTEGIKIMQ